MTLVEANRGDALRAFTADGSMTLSKQNVQLKPSHIVTIHCEGVLDIMSGEGYEDVGMKTVGIPVQAIHTTFGKYKADEFRRDEKIGGVRTFYNITNNHSHLVDRAAIQIHPAIEVMDGEEADFARLIAVPSAAHFHTALT